MANFDQPIAKCPGRSPTDKPQRWYRLPSAPAFWICSRCFHDHLTPSPFGGKFQYIDDESYEIRFCDFNVPRMNLVMQQALDGKGFSPLRDYMMRRGRISHCKGDKEVLPEENFTWFSPRDPDAADLIRVCNACYEEYVVAADYTQHFAEEPVIQPSESQWKCALGGSFGLKLAVSGGDWTEILPWLLHRKNLPDCPAGTEVNGDSRRWFQPSDSELSCLQVCEVCFYDTLYGTVAADQFESSSVRPSQNSGVSCCIGGNITLRFALSQAIERNDWAIIHRAAQVFVRNPRCQKEGIKNGTWYSIIPSCDNFRVCVTCYVCLFETMDAGHFLAPNLNNSEGTLLCSLNLFAPRAQILYQKMDQAMELGNVNIFADYARRSAAAPPCPGSGPIRGRHWYTHQWFTCCPSCWIEAPIENTRFSAIFSDQTVEVSEPCTCDFYSPRIRQLWDLACSEDDLPGFIDFMQKRLEIWKYTYPLIQKRLVQIRSANIHQQTLLQMSLQNQGINGIAAAMGINEHYGNGQMGYNHNTYLGAVATFQFNQALGLSVANAPLLTEMKQLQELWESVE